MYGSWGSGPSMGSNEPGGSNNRGNNGEIILELII